MDNHCHGHYHLSPDGYMMRISAMTQRECVRIGKKALMDGLSFFGVGKLLIAAYHKHKDVENVKVIFVAEPDFSYEKLSDATKKSKIIRRRLITILIRLIWTATHAILKTSAQRLKNSVKII